MHDRRKTARCHGHARRRWPRRNWVGPVSTTNPAPCFKLGNVYKECGTAPNVCPSRRSEGLTLRGLRVRALAGAGAGRQDGQSQHREKQQSALSRHLRRGLWTRPFFLDPHEEPAGKLFPLEQRFAAVGGPFHGLPMRSGHLPEAGGFLGGERAIWVPGSWSRSIPAGSDRRVPGNPSRRRHGRGQAQTAGHRETRGADGPQGLATVVRGRGDQRRPGFGHFGAKRS